MERARALYPLAMSTTDYALAAAPADGRERQLWLQHAAGFILYEDVRGYALSRVDPALDPVARRAAEQAIDDALYGLMMVIDGVSGALRGPDFSVELDVTARLIHRGPRGEDCVAQTSLRDGDGMCMGYQAWRVGDFGSPAVATPRR